MDTHPPQGLVFASSQDKSSAPRKTLLKPVQIVIGRETNFQSTTFNRKLKDGFNVTIYVEGQSVHIYTDEELVFNHETLLRIATGKVGFRNNGVELALVGKVQVKQLR